MRIQSCINKDKDFKYRWPDEVQEFSACEYKAAGEDGLHSVRIGVREKVKYGEKRKMVVVWIDGYPFTQFVGADDYDSSGEVVSEIKFFDSALGKFRRCLCKKDGIPPQFADFKVVRMQDRVNAPGVPDVWAVVVGIRDHEQMAEYAGLRRQEKLQAQSSSGKAGKRRSKRPASSLKKK